MSFILSDPRTNVCEQAQVLHLLKPLFKHAMRPIWDTATSCVSVTICDVLGCENAVSQSVKERTHCGGVSVWVKSSQSVTLELCR